MVWAIVRFERSQGMALRSVVLLGALALCAASCSRTPLVEAPQGRAAANCPVPKQRTLDERPDIIAPDTRVPEFVLATDSCKIYDSRTMIGKEAFVVVFFASWCKVCEEKLPLIQDTLEQNASRLTTLLVSLDEREGWEQTRAFLQRHGWQQNAVVGRDFVGFSVGYNPFRSVPVVVVVGRSGKVIDVQIGHRRGDEERLAAAIQAAISEPPEGVTFVQAVPSRLPGLALR